MTPKNPALQPTRWCTGLSELAAQYDGYVIDQFGVLHDGQRPYPGASQALRELRARGAKVIVLSNSGKRAELNAQRMKRFDVDPSCYDRLVTSGELTWQLLSSRDRPPFDAFGAAAWLLNPADDRAMVEGVAGLREARDASDASFVLLASLTDEQTPETLEPLLQQAAARRLPMVCANPDRLRFSNGQVVASSGAVAARYEALGGSVTWIGKPHPLIYTACREQFAAWGATRLCAIGDSLEHDIGGGAAAGFDTCFIAGGLHAEAFAGLAAAATDAEEATAARDQVLTHLLNEAASQGPRVPAPTWTLNTLHW